MTSSCQWMFSFNRLFSTLIPKLTGSHVCRPHIDEHFPRKKMINFDPNLIETCFPVGRISNLLVQLMAWRQTSKPLPEIMMTHYPDTINSDVVMGAMAFQITVVSIVRSTVCSKKTFKLRATDLFEGNPPVNGGFPSQRASNAENVSIRWRHHAYASKGRNEFAKRSMQRYDVNLSLKIGC